MNNTRSTGRVALVTGAASGIGAAVTDLLLAKGLRVVGADITPHEALGENHLPVSVDLSTERGAEDFVNAAAERFQGIDALVNCVGVQLNREDGFETIDDDDWARSYEINFATAMRCIRAVLPEMKRRGGGAIVSISSLAASEPQPPNIDYAAFKAALTTASKALSREVALSGIRVNTVSPGPVDTPQFRRWFEGSHPGTPVDLDERMRRYAVDERGLPFGRLGTAREVAAVIAFLLGDDASNVTGADIRVDGGASRGL